MEIIFRIGGLRPSISCVARCRGEFLVKAEFGTPKRIRIAVYSLKGCCPRPLDDGGTQAKYSRDRATRQHNVVQYYKRQDEQDN